MTESTTRYILTVPIEKIYERIEQYDYQLNGHYGATYKERSLGWYVQFAGSSESIKLDDQKPTWTKGDTIRITFERIET